VIQKIQALNQESAAQKCLFFSGGNDQQQQVMKELHVMVVESGTGSIIRGHNNL